MAIFRPHGIDYRDVSYEFAVCMLIFGGILLHRQPQTAARQTRNQAAAVLYKPCVDNHA
jgi:hypothetical protein